MKKVIIVLFLMSIMLVGSVSAYYCIDGQEDNQEVISFKNNVNRLALKQDIASHNLTEEAFYLKLKYFIRCD